MMRFDKHNGYKRTFQENKLTLGMTFPLEAYEGNVPVMDLEEQIKRAKLAEENGFAALYVRDVPLNDPMFGDAGQMYDPWVFLSYVAAQTKEIALGTASVITSFQNPVYLAKSAASVDKISGERLLLGLATGDRPVEFEVFGVEREKRAAYYRETMNVMKLVWSEAYPVIETERVKLNGETDILPKPLLGDIPTFVTGYSGQTLEWIAEHGDGWMSYPRNPEGQGALLQEWRAMTNRFKPFAQSLSIDLLEDPAAAPSQIHLGYRTGRDFLLNYLKRLEEVGVNHVLLGLKFSERPIDEVIRELGEEVVPYFPVSPF